MRPNGDVANTIVPVPGYSPRIVGPVLRPDRLLDQIDRLIRFRFTLRLPVGRVEGLIPSSVPEINKNDRKRGRPIEAHFVPFNRCQAEFNRNGWEFLFDINLDPARL